jgi:DinB superfamily
MSGIISEFESSPAKLTTLLERIMAAGKLDVPRSEGKWTPRFIVHHLADAEVLHSMRFPAMLTNDKPSIVPGQPDALAALTEYSSRDPMVSTRAFAAMRNRNVELLRSLSSAQLERTAVHPKYGEFTMTGWAGHVTKHDQLHLLNSRQASTCRFS